MTTQNYHRRWRKKNREKHLAWRRVYYKLNKEQRAEYYRKNKRRIQKRYQKNRTRILKQRHQNGRLIKIRVLPYYGKNKELLCCWRGCSVRDLDCLTLDHKENDGREHRSSGFPGGVQACRKLELLGYPKGFQTLCANHQLKKEIRKRIR